MQLVFARWGWPDHTDDQVMDEDMRLARQAEDLGFDCLWPVEHHFFDYSFCPDNTQLLSYLAAATERIDLGTAAVIMPWNEPLRVAEKIAMLDHLADGRVRFGMGRGLSRREYHNFRGIEMSESRERFDEASLMIVEALETGFIEGDGPFYPQVRKEIRPRPTRSFIGRTYAVANSPDSIDACAAAGANIIMFAESNWEKRLPSIERYNTQFSLHHDRTPPIPLTADFAFCHADPDTAVEIAQ